MKGVRYFMIKSWNAPNVSNAMRDGLWQVDLGETSLKCC